MIKFFRIIRQKLVIENKFSKYLIYAIGEIVLVMIGILLALQVNNLNEQRKNAILEVQYLERLVGDLEADTTYYEERIAFVKLANRQLDFFIHKMYESQKNIEDVRDLFRYLILNTDHLASQKDTYQELINSGKFDLVQNKVLKDSITDYYRFYEDLALQVEEFNLVSTQYLVESARTARNWGKFVRMDVQIVNGKSPYDDPKMISKDEWQYFNDPLSEKFQSLESMAFIYWVRNNEHLSFFTKLKAKSGDLAYQIKEEIDARK